MARCWFFSKVTGCAVAKLLYISFAPRIIINKREKRVPKIHLHLQIDRERSGIRRRQVGGRRDQKRGQSGVWGPCRWCVWWLRPPLVSSSASSMYLQWKYWICLVVQPITCNLQTMSLLVNNNSSITCFIILSYSNHKKQCQRFFSFLF